jgi:hypothetical protein
VQVLHILHADPQGPRILVDLEFARLCLNGAQHGVESLALEERMFLSGDEDADEGLLA